MYEEIILPYQNELAIELLMVLLYILKSSGPKIDPCGAPIFVSVILVLQL